MKQHTLDRTERIKSRKAIDNLFKDGRRFTAGQFRVHWLTVTGEGRILFGVGAGTRHFKRAVDRNRIKRLCRECWRTGNAELKQLIGATKLDLRVFLIFTGRELPDHAAVVTQVNGILQKLSKMFHEKDPSAS